MTHDLETIKTNTIAAVFADTRLIGAYGSLTETGASASADTLWMGSPVAELANKISEIVAKLRAADPRQAAAKPTRLESFTGRAIERQVLFHASHKQLDQLLAEAEHLARKVRDALSAMAAMLADHRQEVDRLTALIEAGQQYLQEHPEAGRPIPGSIDQFDNPRERFSRKLANLKTLHASHEMTVAQLQLARTPAIAMLDRFHETTTVLVPVWRQHSLALLTTQEASATLMAEAAQSQEALVRSLAQSLNA